MGFKLENIKLEGSNSKQEIIRNYDFRKSLGLSGDRTFSRCREDCSCEYVCRGEQGKDPCPVYECRSHDSCPCEYYG